MRIHPAVDGPALAEMNAACSAQHRISRSIPHRPRGTHRGGTLIASPSGEETIIRQRAVHLHRPIATILPTIPAPHRLGTPHHPTAGKTVPPGHRANGPSASPLPAHGHRASRSAVLSPPSAHHILMVAAAPRIPSAAEEAGAVDHTIPVEADQAVECISEGAEVGDIPEAARNPITALTDGSKPALLLLPEPQRRWALPGCYRRLTVGPPITFHGMNYNRPKLR